MESDGIVPVLRGLVCNNKADSQGLAGFEVWTWTYCFSHEAFTCAVCLCTYFWFCFSLHASLWQFQVAINQNIDKFQKCTVFHFFLFTKDRSYFWQLWSLSCLHTNKSDAYVPALYYCIFVCILHIDSV